MSLYLGKAEELTRELARYPKGTLVHAIGSGRVVFTDERNATEATPLFAYPTEATQLYRGKSVVRISDGTRGTIMAAQGEDEMRLLWVSWNDYTYSTEGPNTVGVPVV